MTAIAPSPTAEATRFTESARTSPATKTPGMLASSGHGSRSSGQPRGRSPVDDQVGTGEHETALVALEGARQPVGARLRPDEHEGVARVDPLGRARRRVPQGQASRWPSPCASSTVVQSRTDTLSMASHLLDEVGGHAAFQRVAAHDQGHRLGHPGEEHRRLPGRVGAADDVDVHVDAVAGLARGRAVVEPAARQVADAGTSRSR